MDEDQKLLGLNIIRYKYRSPYSLWISASSPRPPSSAYFSWGKSFYEVQCSVGQPCRHPVESMGKTGTHHSNGNIANVRQEPDG